MRPTFLSTLGFVMAISACTGRGPEPLDHAREAAIRDSVETILTDYAAFLSHWPGARDTRAGWRAFLAEDVVFSSDDDNSEPVVIVGLDSTLGPDLGSRPTWLRNFAFTYERRVVTPLAPGLAAVTVRYRERWTDSTGADTFIVGAQLLVLRHTASGWRIVQMQVAHPLATHRALAAMFARFEPAR